MSKGKTWSYRNTSVTIICTAAVLVLFLIDVERTPDMMVGFFYVIPVLMSYWSTDRRIIYMIALLASVASVAGLFLAASGIPAYMIVNRPFSVLLLWIAAFIGEMRLRALASVELEKERLSTVIETLPVGVSVVDRDGRMVQINPMVRTIWGQDVPMVDNGSEYGKFRAKFHDTGQGLKPEDWPTVLTLRDGKPRLGDILEIERFDGKRAVIDHSVVPVKDVDGNAVGAVVVIRDITERVRLEQELDIKARELARSNEELRQFAYVASHDLQEPLRMVTNYLGLLEREYASKLDGEALEYVKYAVRGGLRMKGLIDDLLAFSRVESQKKPMTLVDMNKVVDQAVEDLRAAIAESNAEVQVDPLPTLVVDEIQMLQVMTNLLGNAIKFRGSEPPQVQISSSRSGDGWVFKVRDNGIGINPAYSDTVFQMFVRLHSKDKYPGTGMGLPICRRIIERHGGRIWVESQEGKGATFYFSIPADRKGWRLDERSC